MNIIKLGQIKKLIQLDGHLAWALRVGAALTGKTQMQFIRDSLDTSLRGIGNSEIEHALDERNRVARELKIS